MSNIYQINLLLRDTLCFEAQKQIIVLTVQSAVVLGSLKAGCCSSDTHLHLLSSASSGAKNNGNKCEEQKYQTTIVSGDNAKQGCWLICKAISCDILHFKLMNETIDYLHTFAFIR